jgi:hypothetical protein
VIQCEWRTNTHVESSTRPESTDTSVEKKRRASANASSTEANPNTADGTRAAPALGPRRE